MTVRFPLFNDSNTLFIETWESNVDTACKFTSRTLKHFLFIYHSKRQTS